MKLFAIALPALAALAPASVSAMSPFEAPSVEEARTVYSQCLSVGAARAARTAVPDREAAGVAKSGCAQHRQALIEAADGNLDVVAALDEIDDRAGATIAVRTRAIRVRRVALATQ